MGLPRRGLIFAAGAASLALAGAGIGVAATHDSSTTPHAAASPSSSPSQAPPASPTDTPVPSPLINDQTDAVDNVGGTALVQFTPGSHLNVAATAESPGQLAIDPNGRITLQVTMTNAAGDVFSIAGPAAVGTETTDQVSVLDAGKGLTLDSTQGDSCTVTFNRAAESGVQGTAHCATQTQGGAVTVTVPFRLFLVAT